MSRSLNDLHPNFRKMAVEMLAKLSEIGIPVMVVDTLRTAAEQEENLAKGVSWTTKSKHLIGMAIDVCPFEIYQLHGPDKLQWAAEDPIWREIGKVGEELGMVWGGRWKQKDMGHFEAPQSVINNALMDRRKA